MRDSMLNTTIDWSVLEASYGATPLHIAAFKGDKAAVTNILQESPQQFLQRTKPTHSANNDIQRLSGATVLHYALLKYNYDIAEMLLKSPQCSEIIDMIDEAGNSILDFIALLPDEKKAVSLAELALANKNIDVNYCSSKYAQKTALHIACQNKNLELVRCLLHHGADPNILAGYNPTTVLHELATALLRASEPSDIQKINEIISFLLLKGANPAQRNSFGETFIDYVLQHPSCEAKLNKEIKQQLTWVRSTPEEIAKAEDIYNQTYPFLPNAKEIRQSPTLRNTALLVQLKRERRLANHYDYDCTVLNDRHQLKVFLEFAKLRFEATKQPFQTQFIIQPRSDSSGHVANGQLSFDAEGNPTVFWVDVLGHNTRFPVDTKKFNKEIGELIHQHLAHTTLYTTDISIQDTESGCHNLTMYISEQLSVTDRKEKDLYGDLNTIHQKNKWEEDNFRIIPWQECPAYTGIPRVIQSASKPQARMEQNLPEDQKPINKKGQHYKQIMDEALKRRKGKIVNTTYDTKRQKFGKYLNDALDKDYGTDTLKQKVLAGFTDIINRIPTDALLNKLDIQFISKDNDMWEISIPEHCRSKHFPQLKGTIGDLKNQLNFAYTNLYKDAFAFKDPNLLYQYAAIRAATAVVNDLELKQTKTSAKLAQGFFNQTPNSTDHVSKGLREESKKDINKST